ncbi:methyltransferase domain-containing protein [Halalkalicoccus jeotgali]|uniref:tRNA methyltransferase complex GCD14 subunit n=1 Tax=Halalkalicoccus jeotgali (strain DSM 18796 / CECT 7217 / JCM 14584 / KCTC 4019 / B3) TaxID=795797 RepID=D8J8A5_HALJB|nr:methyltransferase domain-containing protein [Halalkalicoccus jeotgali]ADJ16151.1 tRNA methyltransferase complex GCD14 subunit [Halalkalicoccus jeotgali B3]ELY37580.1 tRNA methyltransferase complex GCD14 subunit [Halalkalicoccus jeotgali B3]
MILLTHGDREYLREPGEELQTDLGVVEIPDDARPGDVLESHLGEEFRVRRLRGPDLFNHLQRTGAPMLPRDIGLVLGETGIAAGDRVLDAGTGTGVLATYMGRVGAEVITYERNPEFAEVARENVRLAGVTDRVEVRTGDLTNEADPSGFDVLTLDTEDAPDVVARAGELLVPGGFLAVYSPFIEATREVVETARGTLSDVRAVETIQRELDVDERGTRPSTGPVGHSGYLVFARNV